MVFFVLNMIFVFKENLILKLVMSFKWNVIYKNKIIEVFFFIGNNVLVIKLVFFF